MTTLHEALAAMSSVDWRRVSPQQAVDVGDFLEKSLNEIIARENAVTVRERTVSERESAVQVREDDAEARLAALNTVERVRDKLASSVTPAGKSGRRGWFARRA